MRIIILAAFAASLFFSGVATGDDGPLDRIVVTGARTPIALNRLGNASTIIDRADIERREARTVAELLRGVPGFAVSHTGVTGSQTQVRVRGAEANHVLVLIDGVRANDPATGDEFRWEFLSTAGIERIEIVRGAQSSLWGSDAISAVIHIITRSAVGNQASAYLEGGSFGTTNGGVRGSYDAAGWTLSGSVERQQTDGQNISRSGNEDDDAELTSISLDSRYAASESLNLSAGLRIVDAYSQYDPVDFFVTGLPVDGDVSTDSKSVVARLGADWRNAELTHRLGIQYFDSDNDNRVNGAADSATAADRLALLYQLDFPVGDNKASIALEHEETGFEQQGAVVFGDPNQQQDIDASAAVFEIRGDAGRLNWLASARYDHNSLFDDALNGRLALSWPVGDATSLRASVGSGRKNPTFIEIFGFFPASHDPNPDLKPERSVSWELGLHRVLAGGAAQFDLALYHQDLEDEIDGFVFDPGTFRTTSENRSSASRRSGAEASLLWTVSDQFGIRAHYSYTDSSEPDFGGRDVRELRRPRHSGGLGLNYSSPEQRFTTTLTADFGGERRDTFFPPFPNPPETLTLDSYWLVDLAMQYRASDSLTVYARGSNLLDEKYEQVYGYRTLGRAAYAGVRLRFGN